MIPSQTITSPLQQTLKLGQSIWYDGLIGIPEFERMIREDALRGATTNPSIFEKALAGQGNPQVRELANAHAPDEIYKTIAVLAVQEVADAFLPVFEESKGEDGFVSMEVNPHLAYDTLGTLREARELHQRINRKNIMIKVPATKEGLPAIQTLISEGISVNVTLIFSVKRYQEVMNAYLAGLEARHDRGKPVANIASVASFFVSRVDTAVDKLLEEQIQSTKYASRLNTLKNLVGKVAIANSKVAYKEFENFFSTFRFTRLKGKGAQVQRPLWASTGTKNPAYSDVLYVESLIGPNTVNTMPPATLAAFKHHGTAASRLSMGFDDACKVLKELHSLGIDLQKITEELETAGVQLFKDAHDKVIQNIKVNIP